jgi:hypothetical protein
MKKLFILTLFLLLSINVYSAKLETLTDNFNDNSIDTVKWDAVTFTSGSVVEASGKLTLSTGTDAMTMGVLSANDLYDITESFISFKVIDVDTQEGSRSILGVTDSLESATYLSMFIFMSGDFFAVPPSGNPVGGAITYDSDIHKYFRIRESSGVTYFDYSTDGIDWTTMGSEADGVGNPSNLYVPFYIIRLSDGPALSVTIDDINVLPEGSVSVDGQAIINIL